MSKGPLFGWSTVATAVQPWVGDVSFAVCHLLQFARDVALLGWSGCPQPGEMHKWKCFLAEFLWERSAGRPVQAEQKRYLLGRRSSQNGFFMSEIKHITCKRRQQHFFVLSLSFQIMTSRGGQELLRGMVVVVSQSKLLGRGCCVS